MNCLCCGKPLRPPVPSCGWHSSCVKRFFGTADFPELELTNETLALLADQTVNHGYTVPGVQKKLSLHLSREGQSRLTLVDYPTGYILKPQVQEYTALPESEHLIMLMAEAAGLSVVPHGLIPKADGYAYNSTSKMQITDGKMVSWLQADFIVPEEKVGVLSWTGVNSSANWLNFLGDLTFNDGTRIKIDDSIVREFCGEDPASSTAFESQELVFTPGRHKIRFEYEKILTPPERDDMFRLSNLKLILDTSKIDAVGADDTSVVATSIFSASGEQLGSLRKGVNIIKKTYQDGHVSVSKVIVK